MTQRETDHPTPAPPEATEREAREKLRDYIVNPHQLHGQGCGVYARTPRECSCYMRAAGEKKLDAYAAAVRRAERERIAGIVEGMENTDNPWRDSSVDLGRDSHDDGFDAACAALLDRLREGA